MIYRVCSGVSKMNKAVIGRYFDSFCNCVIMLLAASMIQIWCQW